jgi:hypothetical protein
METQLYWHKGSYNVTQIPNYAIEYPWVYGVQTFNINAQPEERFISTNR